MTSIIYSLSLGFIIFLLVCYNLQIKNITLLSYQSKGCDVRVESSYPGYLIPFYIEYILDFYQDDVADFGYASFDLTRMY